MSSFTKLDHNGAESGVRFPIHVVVSVSLKASYPAQIDSKSKTTMLFKSLWLCL